MKVIDQCVQRISTTPGEFDKAVQHIESVGRICYRSDTKEITAKTGLKFSQKMQKSTHYAMLEHTWIVLRVPLRELVMASFTNNQSFRTMIDEYTSNFLHIYAIEDYIYVCGNYRAFLETLYEKAEHEEKFNAMPEAAIKEGFGIELCPEEEIPKSIRCYTAILVTDRATTHQLVRHRPCSFAQESQRYCRYSEDINFIRPYTFKYDINIITESESLWRKAMSSAEFQYHELLKVLPAEEARSVLPNSTASRIAITAPIFQWMLMFNLRCRKTAQGQIRDLMTSILNHFYLYNYINKDMFESYIQHE